VTALIVLNSIAAALVVLGLVAATRLGYVTAGGRFDLARRSFELRRGAAERDAAAERRAA
jgi:hypothetical protein